MPDGERHDFVRSEAPPPFFGTWRRLYALVIGALAFWIVVFWLFTRAFTP